MQEYHVSAVEPQQLAARILMKCSQGIKLSAYTFVVLVFIGELCFMDIQENAVSVTGSTWSINLRGDSYCRLPVRKGGKFLIEASKGPKWSNGPVATETDYGPEGHKTIFNGVTPAFPLGALIGTLSAIKHEGKMDGDVFRRFFSPAKGYPILPIWCGFIPEYNGYEGVAPFSGYLYMVMNDENSFADNVGAINLTVKM